MKLTREQNQVAHSRRRARALEVENTLTLVEWQQMLDEARGRCFYCTVLVGRTQLTIDHVKPLVIGGANSVSNIVAACGHCNTTKGAIHEGIDYRAEARQQNSLARQDALERALAQDFAELEGFRHPGRFMFLKVESYL